MISCVLHQTLLPLIGVVPYCFECWSLLWLPGMGTACSMLFPHHSRERAPVSSSFACVCVYMGLWSTKILCLEQLLKHGGHPEQLMYSRDLFIAVRNGECGTDDHLFVMSLVLNRPVFLFNAYLTLTPMVWNCLCLEIPEHIHCIVVMHRLTFKGQTWWPC